jgi:acyl-CoA reductase-like NAD-dependent aldehyde dehydrogenase
VVPSKASEAQALAEDRRFQAVTFTGSMDVGWRLKQLAWHARRVTLEMGGNAAVVIEPDAGDLKQVARAVAAAAYGYAGQSCISVQRVLVHTDIADMFIAALAQATKDVVAGDPADRSTVCGPLIDAGNADRVEQWIADAVSAGGTCLAGGQRTGNVIEPTLLADVPSDQPVVADEVFGPVAVVSTYAGFDEALDLVNDSRYGLQAGLFTTDATKTQQAWATLEVGGIVSQGVPSWRTDPMPYGGAKGSGIGREGPLYAYRELTEERLLVMRI